MAEEQEQVFYTLSGKKVPPNLVFEYRNIRHIGDPLTETYEQLVERVVQKYKNIDAGLNPDGTPKKGKQTPAAANYQAKQDEKAEKAAMAERIKELEAELAAKQGAPSPKEGAAVQAEDGDSTVEPETPKSVGGGECPSCKRFYRRLDMHVCRAA